MGSLHVAVGRHGRNGQALTIVEEAAAAAWTHQQVIPYCTKIQFIFQQLEAPLAAVPGIWL